MPERAPPTISAVLAAYNSEGLIVEALESILAQTRPPDEIVVVDDGSTDATAAELAGFGERIRVIRQENRGYQMAMNRAIREARSEFVALCGADDVWEPRKLEWQDEAIRAHPEIDVFFGHSRFFGRVTGEMIKPSGEGVLDNAQLADDLFAHNVIATPFLVMSRSLLDRVGQFIENFPGDDYEYWFRCMRHGVGFYFDPRLIGHYRRHQTNLTNDSVGLYRAMNLVRWEYGDLAGDQRRLRHALAVDLFRVARGLVDHGRPDDARREFRRALRYAADAPPEMALRTAGWVAVLSLPEGVRRRLGERLVATSQQLKLLGILRRPTFQ